MKSKYLRVWVICYSVLLGSSGCRAEQLAVDGQPRNYAQVSNKEAQAPPAPTPQKKLNREGRWRIPGSLQTKAGQRLMFADASTEAIKVHMTWLEPVEKRGLPVALGEELLSETELRQLGVSGGKMIIRNLIRYDVDGRPFCYSINIYPLGIPATSSLYYYDEDGDGTFDSVELGEWRAVPRLPSWVAKGESAGQ